MQPTLCHSTEELPRIALSEIADVLSGVASLADSDEGIEFACVLPGQLSPTGISGDFGVLRRSDPSGSAVFLKDGDILLRRINPEFAVVFRGADCAVLPSINLLVIRPRGQVEPDWFAFVLSATPVLARLREHSGVESHVSSLTPRKLMEAKIPLPPPRTRKALVGAWRASMRLSGFLDDLAERQRQIRELLGAVATNSAMGMRPSGRVANDTTRLKAASSETASSTI